MKHIKIGKKEYIVLDKVDMSELNVSMLDLQLTVDEAFVYIELAKVCTDKTIAEKHLLEAMRLLKDASGIIHKFRNEL